MTEEIKQEVQKDPVITEGMPFAVIGYLGVLCLVPLLLKKENKFALFHGKQGLVIFIAEIAAGVLTIIPIIGWVMAPLIIVALTVMSIIGIIQALMGNYFRMPIIADFADKFKI